MEDSVLGWVSQSVVAAIAEVGNSDDDCDVLMSISCLTDSLRGRYCTNLMSMSIILFDVSYTN